MFYNTFLEQGKNYNYTCKNISFGCFLPLFYKLPPPESPFKAILCGLCSCKFALFGICIYIRKMKIR